MLHIKENIIFSIILLILLAITYYIMIEIDAPKPKDEKMNPIYLFVPIVVAGGVQVAFNFMLSVNDLRKNTYHSNAWNSKLYNF